MKRILCLFVFICMATILVAQTAPKKVVKPAIPPNLSYKELKKRAQKFAKQKKYKLLLAASDSMLKRKPKDMDAQSLRLGALVQLKMDAKAIAQTKLLVKNKDSAATEIVSIPYTFNFPNTRSPKPYIDAAMAYGPKNGMVYIIAGALQVRGNQRDLGFANVEKGYHMVNDTYKAKVADFYANVQYEMGKKEEAYNTLYKYIDDNNFSYNFVHTYFDFFDTDKRYQEGLDKANYFFEKYPEQYVFLVKRARFLKKLGKDDQACSDAKQYLDSMSSSVLITEFECPEFMADVTPTEDRTYIYAVNFQGKDYDFRVSRPVVDMDNGISFKFKMSGENAFEGRVSISKEALETAYKQNNYFNSEDLELTDETTVWVSKKVFNDIANTGMAEIGTGGWSPVETFSLAKRDDGSIDYDFLEVTYDEEIRYVKCFRLVSEDGDQEIWINTDPTNPLIIRMNVGFSIELKQVL